MCFDQLCIYYSELNLGKAGKKKEETSKNIDKRPDNGKSCNIWLEWIGKEEIEAKFKKEAESCSESKEK